MEIPLPRRRQAWQDRRLPADGVGDMAAAKRFFDNAMGASGDPNKVAMD